MIAITHPIGLLPDALESYGEAAKYSSIVEEGWSEEEKSKIIDWRTKDLKVQAARTLAAQNKHDIALHFVSQILSADEAYVPALTEYVELMIDYKKVTGRHGWTVSGDPCSRLVPPIYIGVR